jgi:hypothetical protein
MAERHRRLLGRLRRLVHRRAVAARERVREGVVVREDLGAAVVQALGERRLLARERLALARVVRVEQELRAAGDGAEQQRRIAQPPRQGDRGVAGRARALRVGDGEVRGQGDLQIGAQLGLGRGQSQQRFLEQRDVLAR